VGIFLFSRAYPNLSGTPTLLPFPDGTLGFVLAAVLGIVFGLSNIVFFPLVLCAIDMSPPVAATALGCFIGTIVHYKKLPKRAMMFFLLSLLATGLVVCPLAYFTPTALYSLFAVLSKHGIWLLGALGLVIILCTEKTSLIPIHSQFARVGRFFSFKACAIALLSLTLLTFVFVFRHSGYEHSSALWLSVITSVFIFEGAWRIMYMDWKIRAPLSLILASTVPIVGCIWAMFSAGPRFTDPFLPSVFFIATCTISFLFGLLIRPFMQKVKEHVEGKQGHWLFAAYCIPTLFFLSLTLNKLPGFGVVLMTVALVLWTALCYLEPHA